jgi:hypothetical protein
MHSHPIPLLPASGALRATPDLCRDGGRWHPRNYTGRPSRARGDLSPAAACALLQPRHPPGKPTVKLAASSSCVATLVEYRYRLAHAHLTDLDCVRHLLGRLVRITVLAGKASSRVIQKTGSGSGRICVLRRIHSLLVWGRVSG